MGTITVIAGPELRTRIYDEGAAIPYRGMSVIQDNAWDDGMRILTIITDQTPSGFMGWGHFDAVIEGDRITFKKDCDV